MYLEAFSDNPFATNCWMVAADGSDDAVVVDPGFEPARIRSMLGAAGKRPVAVLASHGHFDHVGSAGVLCGDGLPLYIHEADELALTDPAAWGSGIPVPPVPVKDVRTVVEGDVLEFAGFRIEVMHTPGHTPGSVCFVTDGYLFSGDLVFRGSIGRSDFPNSSPPEMEASLRRFLTLPDPLPVYPGHGPDTTVGYERRTNPFLLELRP
jgi:glyoxylase-like metal-dependent hydrolase (beta-lactamase superfamily II)